MPPTNAQRIYMCVYTVCYFGIPGRKISNPFELNGRIVAADAI